MISFSSRWILARAGLPPAPDMAARWLAALLAGEQATRLIGLQEHPPLPRALRTSYAVTAQTGRLLVVVIFFIAHYPFGTAQTRSLTRFYFLNDRKKAPRPAGSILNIRLFLPPSSSLRSYPFGVRSDHVGCVRDPREHSRPTLRGAGFSAGLHPRRLLGDRRWTHAPQRNSRRSLVKHESAGTEAAREVIYKGATRSLQATENTTRSSRARQSSSSRASRPDKPLAPVT
ncbi:hypothetical protein HPB48_005624 [Haemaphysalis longicornis]|uniref:Uncharacterized protein n=1 Tax=Haemaphysalis longicornis TaxID=44386 RepID=A0A9J6GIA7_HAELO|nr:hypothetical protein HPB48_005624 [Haemaphysalis longicornis]